MTFRNLICTAAGLAMVALAPCAYAQAVGLDEDPAPAKSDKKAKKTADSAHTATPYSEGVDVFVAGDDNPYTSIRIPCIIKAGKKLIAVAEGRYKDTDQGENDLIASISTDDGATWSKPDVIAKSKGATYNNPCLIYDEEKKLTILFFQRYPQGVKERTKDIPTGYQDERCIRNFVMSTKDGKKWSKPKDITRTTKHDDVTTTCSGPNPGVQIRHGKHKGRLVAPMNEGPYGHWKVAACYSDDHGKTWKIGEHCAPDSGVNEVSVIETDEGGLLIVSRASKGNNRMLTYSEDGGETWGEVTPHKDLPSPGFGCQNGMARYSFEDQAKLGGKSRIIYSSPAGGNRANGIIKMSYDNGKTWPVSKGIGNGPFAYSVLTYVKPGTMGILYEVEAKPLTTIKFAPFTIEWLTDGEDTGLGDGAAAEDDDAEDDEAEDKPKMKKKGKKGKKKGKK